MKSKSSVQALFVTTLVVLDVTVAGLAYVLAYSIRRWIPWPEPAREMGTIAAYWSIVIFHVLSVARRASRSLWGFSSPQASRR